MQRAGIMSWPRLVLLCLGARACSTEDRCRVVVWTGVGMEAVT